MNELEICCSSYVDSLNTTLFGFSNDMLFTNDHEMRFMSQKTEHDKISIGSKEAMPSVWIVIWTHLDISNIVHHFMFTLSWNT